MDIKEAIRIATSGSFRTNQVRVADEVWIATALLHRQYPEERDFTVGRIVQRAEAENITAAGSLRPGVRVHACARNGSRRCCEVCARAMRGRGRPWTRARGITF